MAVSTIKNQTQYVNLCEWGKYGLINTIITLSKKTSECKEIYFFTGWDNNRGGCSIVTIKGREIFNGRNFAIQVPMSTFGEYHHFIIEFTDETHITIVNSDYTDTTLNDATCIRQVKAIV